MKRIQLVAMAGMMFIFSCQSAENENKDAEKKADTAKISQSIRSNTSFLYDLKALEELFSNDNWLIPGKKDSSYFYFSRIGDFKINTYEYRLVKGDSANVQYGHIVQEGDKLLWTFNGQKLLLSNATAGRAVWTVNGNDSLQYEFLRIDMNQVRLTYPDKTKKILAKIAPFSLFLVRSRYDFSHRTRFAFDTTPFKQKK